MLDSNLYAQLRIHLNSGTKTPLGGGTHLLDLLPFDSIRQHHHYIEGASIFSSISLLQDTRTFMWQTSMIFLTNLTSGLLVLPKVLL
jgi:hypothetical protein